MAHRLQHTHIYKTSCITPPVLMRIYQTAAMAEQRCAVECTCRRCTNCGIPTNETRLCRTCQDRRQCPSCEHHLSDGCFDDGQLCRACTNRRQRFPTRRTALDVVTEVDLHEYVKRNAAGDIRGVVKTARTNRLHDRYMRGR